MGVEGIGYEFETVNEVMQVNMCPDLLPEHKEYIFSQINKERDARYSLVEKEERECAVSYCSI